MAGHDRRDLLLLLRREFQLAVEPVDDAAGDEFAGVTFAYLMLGLLTLTGIGPLLLSIAGLFDSFFDFRKFKRKDHSDESHLD